MRLSLLKHSTKEAHITVEYGAAPESIDTIIFLTTPIQPTDIEIREDLSRMPENLKKNKQE